MSGWQIALLALLVLAIAATGVAGVLVGSDAGQAMPISGLVFWVFVAITVVLALIFGLTFLGELP